MLDSRFFLFLPFVLLLVGTTNGQDNELMLRDIYTEESDSVRIFSLVGLAEEYMSTNPAFALECAVKSVIFARKSSELDYLTEALGVAAKACFYTGRIAESANFYLEQAELVEQTGDSLRLARNYGNLAVIYLTSGYNLDSSITYTAKALDLYEQVIAQSEVV